MFRGIQDSVLYSFLSGPPYFKPLISTVEKNNIFCLTPEGVDVLYVSMHMPSSELWDINSIFLLRRLPLIIFASSKKKYVTAASILRRSPQTMQLS